jgi:hypothetical protein
MDVWTLLAVIAAFAVLIVLGPKAMLRNWSWRARIDSWRGRRGR